MKKTILIVFAITCMLFSNIATAQEDLTKSSDFFEKQMPELVKWLDDIGMDTLITISGYEIEARQLYIFLEFVPQSLPKDASYLDLWAAYSEAYAEHSPISLEEAMMFKAVHLFQVDETEINFQVYYEGNVQKNEKEIEGYIYFETDSNKVITLGLQDKAKTTYVKVSFSEVKQKNNYASFSSVKQHLSKEEAFRKVETYIRKHYKIGKKAEVDIKKETNNRMRISVTQLRQEVLPNHAFVKYFGIEKRETLSILITYSAKGGGIEMHCILDGTYGSGIFVPKKEGYSQMEPDFENALEAYTEKFGAALKKELIKK